MNLKPGVVANLAEPILGAVLREVSVTVSLRIPLRK
jgi:hypothetical protein